MRPLSVFPQFNDEAHFPAIRSTHNLSSLAATLFPGGRIEDRFVRALCDEGVLNVKEVLESFEFHRRARRRVRSEVMADLCCGHGLTGVLFALLEKKVSRVLLVDYRQPKSTQRLLAVAGRLAPFVLDKVELLQQPLSETILPKGCAIIGVHACGRRTDDVLELAFKSGGPVAVMPCCYKTSQKPRPVVLRQQLGLEMAVDIDRTYRMTAAGLSVDWDEVSEKITPMNRILIGWYPSN